MFWTEILDSFVQCLKPRKVNRSFYVGVMVTTVVFSGIILECVVNGHHGNGPWLFLTLVTTGLIFVSYYLGGIFNSKCISDEEYRGHAALRLKSQMRLLPISQLIRKQARKAEWERVKGFERKISASGKDPFRNQSDFLIEAIVEGCIFPWYHQISDERLFPLEVQLLLQETLCRLRKKIENIDRTDLMVGFVDILHSHWNEYCAAVKKVKSPNDLLIQNFELAHTYIQNRDEVGKQYESLVSNFLPDLLPPELQAPILCKFFSGILVKGVFLYYADILTDPKWLNTTLVTLISSGNYIGTSDAGSNPSGSNISSAPLSPSSTTGSTPLKEPTYGGDDERFMDAITARVNALPKPPTGGHERSIDTALSGVLSTTALPLLPDGILYKPAKDLTIQFSQGTPKPQYQISPSTRHKSWEATTNTSKPSEEEGVAKSFDESQDSTFVSRQSEFNFGLLQSPAYEEAEDFAATIAKLRSLLEQRESQTNIVEGEEQPSGEGGVKKNHGVLDSQSSGSSDGSSSVNTAAVQAVDAEIKLEKIDDEPDEEGEPIISQFFQDVTIPKTESCGDSNDQFTLYCIQYTGVYVEKDQGQTSSPKLVLRTTTVKRSLNEFLLLQTQLEKNPNSRIHLRGIKSHNTWLTLPFTHRRILLQRYLYQLCAHPVLGFCPELCQFMAYGDDGFQMFAPIPNRSKHHPRFDRLTKTFTGVLNSLKDALPSFADEGEVMTSVEGGAGNRNLKPKKRLHSFFQFGPDKNLTTSDTQTDDAVENPGRRSEDDSESGEDRSTDSEEPKKSEDESEDENLHQNLLPVRELLSPRPESSLDTMYPLASAVTRFLCDVLWLPEQRPKNASVSAVMSVSGKSLEKYLSESMDILLSEDAFVGYMELMTGAIRDWTAATSATQDATVLTVEDLKLCLNQRLPTWVRWVWGRSRLELTIERLAGFFQIQPINHDFLLSVIELIFTKLRTK